MNKLVFLRIAAIVAFMAVACFAQDNNWISEQDPSGLQQDAIDKQIKTLLKLYNSLAGAGFVNTAELHHIGGIDVRLSYLGSPVPEQFRDLIPTVKDPLEGVEFTSYGVLHGNLGVLPRLEVISSRFAPMVGSDGVPCKLQPVPAAVNGTAPEVTVVTVRASVVLGLEP